MTGQKALQRRLPGPAILPPLIVAPSKFSRPSTELHLHVGGRGEMRRNELIVSRKP